MGRKQFFKFAAATGCAFNAIGRGTEKDFAGFTAITAYIFEDRHIAPPSWRVPSPATIAQNLFEAPRRMRSTAAGLANESKLDRIPYGGDSPQLAAGSFNSVIFDMRQSFCGAP